MMCLQQSCLPANSRKMINHEVPSVKPRRKYLEVPVHRSERDKPVAVKKTYSTNFNARKYRGKTDNPGAKISEVIIEIPEKNSPGRISKRALNEEIERLVKDNEEIASKFNELENLSVKKILRLKEKVGNLQELNAEVTKENEAIKYRYCELQKSYEDLYNELEISKVCKRCEELREQADRVNEENRLLKKRNGEICEDLGMLKTVVYRLNVQLERYQEKLRHHNISIEKYSHLQPQKSSTQFREEEIINVLSADHQNHRHTPISWGSVNSHTLGPLLDAYQDTLNEKDEIIQNYEMNLADFTGKMKEVIEENENLYKRLTEDEACSSKLGDQLRKIKSELGPIRDQNDALIKKCALKQDKIEEILKVYENKVEQMKRDYQVVHEEYIKVRTENSSLKERIKIVSDSQDDFKNERQNYIPVSVHTASVNECKKWYEELKQQYEHEMRKMKDSTNLQADSINELNGTIQCLKKSKEELQGKVLKLEKELKKSESKQLDLDHALKEVQLSRSACRKQLHKAMCFAKDMVAEQETLLRALNQRQLENRAVKKIGSEMALRMDSLKSQLKDVQKSAWEEFSTVEQRIQEQTDLIEVMKQDHEKEIEELKLVIAEQEEKLTKNEGEREKRIAVSHYQLFKEKYK
ncbi:protein Cep89 homolog isoform X1 [Euwallacea similis]|uniref:protein Cep89 homolog isoform X1 n=2 Tax=Euwallacea similis TaxID=1736056 RepID=UPI00344F60E0